MTERKVIETGAFLKKFFDIKFWKFVLVGILNTIVGEGIQFVCYNVFGWDSFEWGVVLASFIGIVVGSVVSYFLNKHFTFKNKEKGWGPVLRFTLNIAVCYVIGKVIVVLAVQWLCQSMGWTMFGWDTDTFAGNAALAVGAVAYVACNYIGQRFFAFKEKNQ